jgi:uncharacterized protein (TIGR03435 family)
MILRRTSSYPPFARRAVVCVAICAGSSGQVTAQTPSFEVASLRPVQPTRPFAVELGTVLHGRLTMTNVTFTQCLRFAFKINNDSQFAGPDWIKSADALFNIEAKAPPETMKDQMRLMMRSLLTERFGLKFHHEQRELRYMALVVDRKGSKLRESEGTPAAVATEVRPGRIAVRGVSIGTLIVMLGIFTSTPIVDLTDLKGTYDVKLDWNPGHRTSQADEVPAARDIAEGLSLFDAMQEQLGLRADARKGPMDVIVVDHAERIPIAN